MTPKFDFAFSENAQMIRDKTHRYTTDNIAPLAARFNADDWFPRDKLGTAMGDLGVLGLPVEEDFGGLGLGFLEDVVACKEGSQATISVGLCHVPHSKVRVDQIRRGSNEEQQATYLPNLINGELVGSV